MNGFFDSVVSVVSSLAPIAAKVIPAVLPLIADQRESGPAPTPNSGTTTVPALGLHWSYDHATQTLTGTNNTGSPISVTHGPDNPKSSDRIVNSVINVGGQLPIKAAKLHGFSGQTLSIVNQRAFSSRQEALARAVGLRGASPTGAVSGAYTFPSVTTGASLTLGTYGSVDIIKNNGEGQAGLSVTNSGDASFVFDGTLASGDQSVYLSGSVEEGATAFFMVPPGMVAIETETSFSLSATLM